MVQCRQRCECCSGNKKAVRRHFPVDFCDTALHHRIGSDSSGERNALSLSADIRFCHVQRPSARCNQACRQDRYLQPSDECDKGRSRHPPMAGLDRAQALPNASRQLSADANACLLGIAKVRPLADAAFDFLSRRLCHSRHQLCEKPRPARIARLRPAASHQCQGIVQTCER